MAYKPSTTDCRKVMDILDQSPMAELSEEVREHIAGCADCARYHRISVQLGETAKKDGGVDLWRRFHILEANLKKKALTMRITGVLAGALAAAAVTVALLTGVLSNNSGIMTADHGKIVASNNTQLTPVSDYDLESSDLNYYYEISFRN